MASRKARLVLTSLAIVLGTMFVAAAMVLTSSMDKSLSGLVADAYEGVDGVVSPEGAEVDESFGTPTDHVPADVIDTIGSVDGVDEVDGAIEGQINAIGDNGKLVGTFAPTVGFNWDSNDTLDFYEMQEGEAPESDDEVAVSTKFIQDSGLDIGDEVSVYSYTTERTEFTIVGVFNLPGDRDSMAGETMMAFSTPAAQELITGGEDAYSSVYVYGDFSTGDIDEALGAGQYKVQTGEELSEELAEGLAVVSSFMGYIFLGFGLIAVFVSVFLIINTFTIIVAQRQRELAVLRAMGAARGQVVRSVLLEAVLVGAIASVIGLGLGLLLGWGLSLAVGEFMFAGLAVQFVIPGTVAWALAVGIGVTVLSAVVPALRASRVPPVAAMREAVNPPKPLRGITIVGASVAFVGALLIGLGVTDNLGDQKLVGVLTGVGVAFVGVTMLTPIISKPLVALLGLVMSWTFIGKLGKLNAGRNPRRTAITASALMIAVALITGIATVVSSLKATTAESLELNLDSDLIVSGAQTGANIPTFAPEAVDQIRDLDGVGTVGDVYVDFMGSEVDGEDAALQSSKDLTATVEVFGGEVVDGSIDDLSAESLAIDEDTAEERDLEIGDTIPVTFSNGTEVELRVDALLESYDMTNGWWVSPEQVENFAIPKPMQAFIAIDEGADLGAVQNEVEEVLADEPEVGVTNNAEFVDQQTSGLDTIVNAVQILLALAIIIAVIGVVNTLVLSVLERTRELGLLRAVGMTRGQAWRMITVESIIICVFGAVLGIGVGIGLGWTVQQALEAEGLTTFALPWNLIIVYLVVSVIVGLLAALAPAARASKLNVLGAIAYE